VMFNVDVLFSFGKTPKPKKPLNVSDVYQQASDRPAGLANSLKSTQSSDSDDHKVL